ncbi:hypothetical protein ONE63_003561 [Megalurothrips usitatus]|uniref:Uncharacterized protein n=1 Tax=Megalurothrips usitatus TaxID=439358 RepID=A0AAV7X6T7_9NEOP|nr:hypothetical protein ONE63_003561 [Megalurothrips usitatus]
MLRSALYLVAVTTVAAAAQNVVTSATLGQVQKAGQALAPAFSKEWTTVLNGQRKRVTALAAQLLQQQKTPESKAALSAAIKKLNAALTKVNAAADTLQKQQAQEINSLVAKYVALIKQRQKATGTAAADEAPVVQLRKNKITLLDLWENRVLDINSQYRTAYRDTFKQASGAAASKPAVRRAIRAAFTRLLSDAVTGQEENITSLTAKQFPLVEKFALLAGRILLELVVAAQGALL